MKTYVVTLAACTAAALGTPIAQAHIVAGGGVAASAKSTSSQSALAAMVAAGTKYHAAANYRNEKTLVGSARKVTAQKAVRPDDRAGVRGI
jgi:hypothetical protein